MFSLGVNSTLEQYKHMDMLPAMGSEQRDVHYRQWRNRTHSPGHLGRTRSALPILKIHANTHQYNKYIFSSSITSSSGSIKVNSVSSSITRVCKQRFIYQKQSKTKTQWSVFADLFKPSL